MTSERPSAAPDGALLDILDSLAEAPAATPTAPVIRALTCANVDLLEALCRDRDRRQVLVETLVPRLAGPSWGGPTGTLEVRVTDQVDQPLWSWQVVCTSGSAIGVAEPRTAADVTVTGRVADLVALADGTADGALLHLAGRLAVAGDGDLLLRLGRAVRRGDGTPLIDAGALDPLAVSAAIAEVPTAHLDAVMAGSFRDLVLAEVFGRLPEFLIVEKAAGVRLAVGIRVGGGPQGRPEDRYVVDVADGSATVTADPGGELPVDVTLDLLGAQFLRLVLGHLNPVRAVLGGEVKVRGPLMKALAFNSVMRIPGA